MDATQIIDADFRFIANYTRNVGWLNALVLVLAACGSSNGGSSSGGSSSGGSSSSGASGSGPGSCTADSIVSTNPKTTGKLCVEYGASFTADQVMKACPIGLGADTPGTYSSGLCATANRVGTCVNGDTTARYYSPGYTTALAQTACGGAVFTPN